MENTTLKELAQVAEFFVVGDEYKVMLDELKADIARYEELCQVAGTIAESDALLEETRLNMVASENSKNAAAKELTVATEKHEDIKLEIDRKVEAKVADIRKGIEDQSDELANEISEAERVREQYERLLSEAQQDIGKRETEVAARTSQLAEGELALKTGKAALAVDRGKFQAVKESVAALV
jgi:chromosome segregation ATPase